MGQRAGRRKLWTGCGLLVVLLALTLRLAASPEGLSGAARRALRAAGSPTVYRMAMFLETGLTVPDFEPLPDPTAPAALLPPETGPAPSTQPTEPETRPPAEPETQAPVGTEPPAEALLFLAQEAQAITLRGNCSYAADKTALLLAPLDWPPAEGPRVLIVHTHTCEAYTPDEGSEYEPAGDYHTLDADRSVAAVGDALAEALEALGIEVIHDRSCNDYPSYNDAYANARTRIKAQLEAHPSIVMVIDVHRDALQTPVRETVEADGAVCAPMMLVVGTDEGGLEHPHWQRNLSCALKLQVLMNRRYPDLMKQPALRRERFNGDLTPGSLIVEVGTTENTLPEAKRAAACLAKAVAELVEGSCGTGAPGLRRRSGTEFSIDKISDFLYISKRISSKSLFYIFNA